MKFKLQSQVLNVTNNATLSNTFSIIFTFNNQTLPNAKNNFSSLTLNKFANLDNPGSHTSINDSLLAISLGKKEQFCLLNYLKTIKSVANFLKQQNKIVTLNLILEETLAKLLKQTNNEYIELSIFYLLNHLYYFDDLKTIKVKFGIKNLNLITSKPQLQSLKNSLYMAEGVFLTKNLANSPANIATPTYLAKIAKSFNKDLPQTKVDVLDEKQIKKLNMNTLLAVAKGSIEEAKFIKIEYSGGDKTQKPLVLVGKGVTFDSGGISIKPAPNMDEMKFDMCGAATVMGLLYTVAKLKLPLNIVGLVPCCENLPSGKAVKPGDVITTMSGKTVEIQNTDAEGRLILCDALTYAKKYDPELVINIATLTGACLLTFGKITSALFSNDDTLAKQLNNSSNRTQDKVWLMPMFDEYKELLNSSVADMNNIGNWNRLAGSIIAACFLEKFTDYKWAHLDIAGTAWGGNSIFGDNINGKGATAQPFYLLLDFLRNYGVKG